MPGDAPGAVELGQCVLGERRGREASRVLQVFDLSTVGFRREEPAHAQARRDGLARGAAEEHGLRVHGAQGARAQARTVGLHGEIGVHVVLDDRHLVGPAELHEGAARAVGHDVAGGIAAVGHEREGADRPAFEGPGEGREADALAGVRGDLQGHEAEALDHLQQAVVGRRLHGDDVAGLRESAQGELRRFLRARRHEHLVRRHVTAGVGEARGEDFPERGHTRRERVGERLAAARPRGAGEGALHGLERQEARVGDGRAELQDAGAPARPDDLHGDALAGDGGGAFEGAGGLEAGAVLRAEAHEEPRARAGLDPARVLEALQGGHDGRDAHAVLMREAPDAGQALAGSGAPGADAVAEQIGEFGVARHGASPCPVQRVRSRAVQIEGSESCTGSF